jgi:dimethylhistidine N-methyltransferase
MRSEIPAYDYFDLKPSQASFLNDVITGLSAQRKWLPPKYFYDARGSHLFDAICELPEYYPTRTELAMMRATASEMAARVGGESAVVEYGSGSSRKTPVLIRALQPLAYVAIDISGDHLRSAVAQLATEFPAVRMFAVCADYTQAIPLSVLDYIAVQRRVIYFPGSTIGNFTRPEAHDFLVNARTVAGPAGAMLVGVDLKKDRRILHAAYNDAAGITAEFNLNVLHRINREMGADFEISKFEHRAHYDEETGRIEMHLVSTREQDVHVAGRTFHFARGETIHTENSCKYSVEEFQSLARNAGFDAEYCWVDPERLFSIHYLSVQR